MLVPSPIVSNAMTAAREQHYVQHAETRLMMLNAVLLGNGIGYRRHYFQRVPLCHADGMKLAPGESEVMTP